MTLLNMVKGSRRTPDVVSWKEDFEAPFVIY